MEIRSLGRYQVRGEIGRGTMGVVYHGYDPVIDRELALKTVVLPGALGADQRETFLERFFLEARIAGRLIHPNIVVTHDAATDSKTGIPFIAMELVDGEPLSARLDREGRLPWRDALTLCRSLAQALEVAHHESVVHRDIKPANILLTRKGEPKIADFGIAKLSSAHLTQTGIVMGTPYFMSPEQIQGEPLDGRSDLFSLGSLLYNLLVGHPPFEGQDLESISHKVLYKNPSPPSDVVPEIPGELDGVMARVMAKRPDERYQHGSELAKDLDAILSGDRPLRPLSLGLKTLARTEVSKPTADAPQDLLPRHGSVKGWLLLGLCLTLPAVLVVAFGPRRVRDWLAPVSERLRGEIDRVEDVYEEHRTEQAERAGAISRAEETLGRGKALCDLGEWKLAAEAYASSLELYRKANDGRGEAAALLERGELAARRGAFSEARDDLASAIAVFEIYDFPRDVARAQIHRASLARDRGEFTQAEAFFEAAIAASRSPDDTDLRVQAVLESSLLHLMRARPDAAEAGFREVVSSERAGSERQRDAAVYLGALAVSQGDDDQADVWWDLAEQGSSESLHLWRAWNALRRGEVEKAGSRLKQAEAIYRERKDLPRLLSTLEAMRFLDPESDLDEIRELRARLELPPDSSETSPDDRLRFLFQAQPRTARSEERRHHLPSALD